MLPSKSQCGERDPVYAKGQRWAIRIHNLELIPSDSFMGIGGSSNQRECIAHHTMAEGVLTMYVIFPVLMTTTNLMTELLLTIQCFIPQPQNLDLGHRIDHKSPRKPSPCISSHVLITPDCKQICPSLHRGHSTVPQIIWLQLVN